MAMLSRDNMISFLAEKDFEISDITQNSKYDGAYDAKINVIGDKLKLKVLISVGKFKFQIYTKSYDRTFHDYSLVYDYSADWMQYLSKHDSNYLNDFERYYTMMLSLLDSRQQIEKAPLIEKLNEIDQDIAQKKDDLEKLKQSVQKHHDEKFGKGKKEFQL